MRRRIELPRKCKLDLTNQAWAQRLLAKPVQHPVARANPPAALPKPEPKPLPPEELTERIQAERIQAEIEAAFETFRKRNAEKRVAKRDKARE